MQCDADEPNGDQIERQYESFKPLTIWHTLVIVFVTYAMMPMALAWSFLCSMCTCLGDLVLAILLATSSPATYASQSQAGEPTLLAELWYQQHESVIKNDTSFRTTPATTMAPSSQAQTLIDTGHWSALMWNAAKLGAEILTKFVIYLTINLICLYTKYLIDLAQRNAFLETRRSIETRAKIERENDKQERLLLSLLPRFVALEIIADIAKEDNHDKLLRNQFHKIYIHSYSNVR